MRDGEDGGPVPVLPAPPVDDRDLDTPNCPDCLTRMEPEGPPHGEPYWACAACGLVLIA